MQEPNYKLSFKEGVLIPKHEGKVKDIIKYVLLFWMLTVGVLSILFGENLFSEFSISTWACICVCVGYLIKNSGMERVPSDCELWFYDDYMVQYRPKRYYSRKKIRREYYVFRYSDIKQCQYRTVVGKINIYGVLEGTFYDYDKNGELKETPSYHKTVDAISNFYIVFEPNIDFVKIIEDYTPVKVEISNS